MADGTIVTARIDIVADASGVEAAVARAKGSVASMSKDAQAQYSRLSAAEKRRTDALIRQADTVGMTRAQQIAYNASLKSSGPVLNEITKRLKENAVFAQKSGIEFNKYGISAKQELAALRQVPAQITDIVVSLQGGQAPMTVLLQQGGQLRDIFGGVTPALKAMGGALLGLINPVTLTAAGIIALAVAYKKGSDEAEQFNATLIQTGNAIGVSVDGLQLLAKGVGAATSGQHQAVEVINQFAKAASVSASRLGDYAKVAIQWSDITGQGTQEIVDNFTNLAKDPLDALVKLDDQMHFLTASTYDQIRALEDSGRKTDAAKIAQETYAQALADRTPEMAQNLGVVESAWNAIVRASQKAIDAVMSIGRTKTLLDQIAEQQGKLQAMEGQVTPFGGPSKAALENQRQVIAGLYEQMRMEAAVARAQSQTTQQRIRDTSLAKDRADFVAGGRNAAQRHADEIEKENQTWQALIVGLKEGSREYEKLFAAHQVRLSQIEDKYAEKARSSSAGGKSTKSDDPLGVFMTDMNIDYGLSQYQKYLDFIDSATGRAHDAQTAQQRAWLQEALEHQQITVEEYAKAMESVEGKAKESMSAIDQFSLEAARNIQDSLGDGLYDLLTGKFDDIAKSWGDMITRMVAQAAAAQLGRYLFGDFGNTNQIGGLLGSVGSFASGLFGDGSVSIGPAFTFSANGNVFPSSPDLSALSGGIYNRPTAFRFAKGAGILGEAGSEAVMPLKRGPDGKLGVASQGGGGVTIIMNNNGTPQQIEGEPKVSRDQMGRAVIELMINDVRTNGRFTRTLKGAMT